MKIVVLGGNGNIGAHVIEELKKEGRYDIFCYGRSASCRHQGVSYIQGDRHDREAFIRAMQELNPDYAIDLTCFNAEDARDSIAAFQGVKQFVTASTVCTYGKDFSAYPVKEDDAFTPWTEYGINKHEADKVYLRAHAETGFPVTIIKPGTTYSGMSGMLRQLAVEHTWIDRVKKGRPILICDDGNIMHQYMHSTDTARAFTLVLGRTQCIGQVYNAVQDGFTTWAEYYRLAMKVLGREVELVSLPLDWLMQIDPERFGFCYEIGGQHTYISNEKLKRDVPEWRPRISLEEGLTRVFAEMEAQETIPDSGQETWEDRIIEAVHQFQGTFSALR